MMNDGKRMKLSESGIPQENLNIIGNGHNKELAP